jgi:hypothetical protein
VNSEIEKVFTSINWKLLREQKLYMLNEANLKENPSAYDGVIGLLDAIQDAAVASGMYTEVNVFGKTINK